MSGTKKEKNLKEDLFDWEDPDISNWKKCLRIKLLHGFRDVKVRGLSANESAILLLKFHKDDLNKKEIKFLKSLLK